MTEQLVFEVAVANEITRIKRYVRVIKTPAAYTGGSGFEFMSQDHLCYQMSFVDLLGLYRQIKYCYFKLNTILNILKRQK
jgi:hypothetical protein